MRCWLLPNRISGKAQVEATSQKPPRGLLHFQLATAAHPVAHACFLQEMERGENANGQKSGQVREPTRRLHFLQDLSQLQDHLI
jgi:hypothetical protein